jgi:uncharacterized protein (DUF305 family)
MENKNNTVLFSALFLIGGFVLGWAAFGSRPPQVHQMPDGSMMHGESMSMEDMMHDMNAALVGKTGDEFDKAFLNEMVVHHEGAVEMAKLVKKTSQRPELLKLADDIISAQTKEIEMMKGWRELWFK